MTQRIQISTKDEIGSMVGGFNKFIAKLQDIVSQIKNSRDELGYAENELQDSVSEVSSSIDQIIANINSVGDQMSSQANAVSQTSAVQSKKISAELMKISSTISVVVESSKLSSQSFKQVSEQILNTDQLVRQIRAAMEEQQVGSQLILDEIHNLQESTGVIKNSVSEMSDGAEEIRKTGSRLAEIASQMEESVMAIGNEIDLFKS